MSCSYWWSGGSRQETARYTIQANSQVTAKMPAWASSGKFISSSPCKQSQSEEAIGAYRADADTEQRYDFSGRTRSRRKALRAPRVELTLPVAVLVTGRPTSSTTT